MKRVLLYCIFLLCLHGVSVVVGNTFSLPNDQAIKYPDLDKASSYLQNKKPDSAVLLLNDLLSENREQDGLKEYLSVYLDAAISLHSQGAFQKSLKACGVIDSLVFDSTSQFIKTHRSIALLTGLNLYKLNNTGDAEKKLLQIIDNQGSSLKDSIQVIALKTMGNIRLSQKHFPEALDYYKNALKIEYSRSGYSRKLVSALYQNMAISWTHLQTRDSAQYYFQKALLIKEEYLPPDDLSLASGYLNYSNFLLINSDVPEAINYITKAEKIYTSYYGIDNPVLAPLYQNKGSYLIMINDYDQALIYIQMALDLYQKSHQTNTAIYNSLFLNFGVVFETIDKYEEALDYLLRCTEEGLSVEQKIQLYRLKAMCYEGLTENKAAQENYLRSIKISEAELGEKKVQTAASYFRYGHFLSNINDSVESLNYLNQSLDLYRKVYGDKNHDVSSVLSTIAKFYQTNAVFLKALDYFQQALISGLPEFNQLDYHVNPTEEQMVVDLNLSFILINKASCLYKYYDESHDINDLKLGFETSKLAISQMEKLRSSYRQDNSKLILTSQSSFFYDLNIWGAHQLYQLTHSLEYLDEAFVFAEKSKAAVLLSTVRGIDALNQEFIPQEIKEIERKLKNESAQSQNRLIKEGLKSKVDSVYLAELRNDLHKKNIAYDSLIRVIEKEYPRYYKLKYNSGYLSVDDVQSHLKGDEVFIEYHLADTLLFEFVINTDTAVIHEEVIDTNFSKQVLNFVNMLKKPEISHVSSTSLRLARLGYGLYTRLGFNLPEIAEGSKVIVIPDDILEYVSFDALVTQLPDEKGCTYKKLDYLINHHVLSYGYSGSLFFAPKKSEMRSKKVLAIAPDYKKHAGTLTDSTEDNSRDIDKYLYPLVNSEEEVNYALKIYGGKKIVGKDATESNFKAQAGDYSILHFAMHTILDDENPLASRLIFANDDDSLQDGFLNTYEIYTLDLNADLAVLSACNTGSGNISNGEGIMSMARGFIYAGIPSIIMTLWAVDDYSSTYIVKKFYDGLKEDKDKDVALHDAKLDFLRNSNQLNSHPYFWAAYVQIGDTSPIRSSLLPQALITGVVSLLIIIFLFAYFVYRKKRKN